MHMTPPPERAQVHSAAPRVLLPTWMLRCGYSLQTHLRWCTGVCPSGTWPTLGCVGFPLRD